jgi:hypothetical protein
MLSVATFAGVAAAQQSRMGGDARLPGCFAQRSDQMSVQRKLAARMKFLKLFHDRV